MLVFMRCHQLAQLLDALHRGAIDGDRHVSRLDSTNGTRIPPDPIKFCAQRPTLGSRR
jgi:hypothetical protein